MAVKFPENLRPELRALVTEAVAAAPLPPLRRVLRRARESGGSWAAGGTCAPATRAHRSPASRPGSRSRPASSSARTDASSPRSATSAARRCRSARFRPTCLRRWWPSRIVASTSTTASTRAASPGPCSAPHRAQPRRGEHDHPAARPEHVRRRSASSGRPRGLSAEAQGGAGRAGPGACVHEGPDPGGVPQRDLHGPRLRLPERRPQLSRQERRPTSTWPRRRYSPRSSTCRAPTTPSATRRTRSGGATSCSRAWLTRGT